MAEQITREDVVKFIEGMTVLELSELVKELEERFGVSAAAPVAVAAVQVLPVEAERRLRKRSEFECSPDGVFELEHSDFTWLAAAQHWPPPRALQ